MNEAASVVAKMGNISADKNRVQIRMEQLRNELEQLIGGERRLEVMFGLEQSKSDSLEGSLNKEAHQVSSHLDVVSNNVKVETCVAKKICEFANVVHKV